MHVNTRLLIRKELALQRTNLWFAAAITLVSVLSLLTPIPARTELMPKMLTMGALVQMVHYMLVVPCLVVLVPVMIGASAAATERKLGTLDWQLSLPATRRRLWFVKCAVAAVLALAVGGVLLSLLDALVVFSMREQQHEGFLRGGRGSQILVLRGMWPGIYALLCAMAGAYTSSMSRDPYRALMTGLVFVAFTLGVQMLADPANLLLPKWQSGEEELPYGHHWVQYARVGFLALYLVRLGLLNFDLVGFRLRRIAAQMTVWVLLVAAAAVLSIRVEFTLWDLPVGRPLWNLPPEWGYGDRSAVVSLIANVPEASYYYGHSDLIRLPGTNRILTAVARSRQGRLVEFDLDGPSAHQHPGLPGPVTEILEGRDGRMAFRLEGDICWLPGLSLAFSSRFPFAETLLNAYLGDQPRWLYPMVEYKPPLEPFMLPAGWEKQTILVDGSVQSNVTRRLVGGNTGLVVWERTTSSTTTDKAVYQRALAKWNASKEKYESVDSFESHDRFDNYYFSSNGAWFCRAASSSGSLELRRVDGSSSRTIEPNGKRTYVAPRSICCADEPVVRLPGDLTVFDCSAARANMATSPDGRYLAFLRVKEYQPIDSSSEMAAGLPEAIEISVLDLQSGEEQMLGRIPPSKLRLQQVPSIAERLVLHGYVYGEQSDSRYIQVPKHAVRRLLDILPMAWSDGGKLAVLNDNMLHVFRVGNQGARSVLLFSEDVGDAKVKWVEFFSDRYLLLTGFGSLSRVEIGQRVEHECPVSFLPYDKGTTGTLQDSARISPRLFL